MAAPLVAGLAAAITAWLLVRAGSRRLRRPDAARSAPAPLLPARGGVSDCRALRSRSRSPPSRWRSASPRPRAPRSAGPTACSPTRGARARPARSCSPRTRAAARAGWPRPGKPADPAFSPLGRRIAFGSRSEIWVDVRGRHERAPGDRRPGAEPRPDLVAGRRRDRVRARLQGRPRPLRRRRRRQPRPAAHHGRADDEAPAWGPTGAIAFVRDGDIYVKPPGRRAPAADRRRRRRPRPRVVARRAPDRLHAPGRARAEAAQGREAPPARAAACASCG